MAKIKGHAAIEMAETTGVPLCKYADPVDGARAVSIDEARAIAKEDPSLIYVGWRKVRTLGNGERHNTNIAA